MNSHPATESVLKDGRIVVMAASAGGISALVRLLEMLPANFPAPLVIVQHRTPTHPSLLTTILAARSRLRVDDARDGEHLQPGVVYVARPDLHLSVTPDGRFAYSDGSRIRFVMSSANPLFESAAAAFGAGTIGVVLSGYGRDGTDGVQAIRIRNGVVIAQDEATAEQFGMPGSAILTGSVDYVLPIEDIAEKLVKLVTVPQAL
jgi:two-component system chemotaxis response regulator CheB